MKQNNFARKFLSLFLALILSFSVLGGSGISYAQEGVEAAPTEENKATTLAAPQAIDDLITKVTAYVEQAKEILKRNLEEEYKNELEAAIALAELGLMVQDETTLNQTIEVFENLLPQADEKTIVEESPADKLNALITTAKEILTRNLKEQYRNDLEGIVALGEMGLMTGDETTIGQAITVLETLIPQADENTIVADNSVEILKELLVQAKELLNKNLVPEFKGNLEAAIALAELGITANDPTTIAQSIGLLESLLSQADANIVDEEPEPEAPKSQLVEIDYGPELEPLTPGAMPVSVISDIHILPEDMIANNAEYKKAMAGDRKLFTESEGILKSALEMADKRNSKVVLVSGDLTKDGEYKAHEKVVEMLQAYVDKGEGRKVFIVPGNHDINNNQAFDYNTDGTKTTSPAKRTSPQDYINLYSKLAYDQAIDTFKDSDLFKSYLEKVNSQYQREDQYKYYAHGYTSYAGRIDLEEEGKNGLTVISLDTAKYSIDDVEQKVDGRQNTGGHVSPEQLKWIEKVANEAKERNDAIIVIAHHAFLPHFNNQDKILKDYIIDNWQDSIEEFGGKTPAEVLADLGVSFYFTGHIHAQDIAKLTTKEGNTLYDIETGSTVTYPLPVRHLDLSNKVKDEEQVELKIQTEYIKTFSYKDLDGNVVNVDNGMKHASGNLLTPDLALALANQLLPKDLSASSIIKLVADGLVVDNNEIAQLVNGYVRSSLAGTIDNPAFEKSVAGIAKAKVFYESQAEVNGEKVAGLRVNVKALGNDVDYIITEKDLLTLVTDLFNQLDEKVFSDKRLIYSILGSVADKAFAFPITHDDLSSLPEGQKLFTLSDLANHAYLTHLKGNEKQSKEVQMILQKYAKTSLIKEILLNSKDVLGQGINEMLYKLDLDLLSAVTKMTTKDNFVVRTVDKKLNEMLVKPIPELLESFGYNSEILIEKLLELDAISSKFADLDKMLLSVLDGFTSEKQEGYKAYAYLDDDNTILKQTQAKAIEAIEASGFTPFWMNVRSTPDGEIIGRIDGLKEVSGLIMSENPDWLKIEFQGQEGYIFYPLLGQGLVSGYAPGPINLRSTPNGDIISSTPKGKLIEGVFYEKNPRWAYANVNGEFLYLYSPLLQDQPVKDQGYTIGQVNFRTSPNGEIVSSIAKYTFMEGTIDPINTNWLKVNYRGQEGYVYLPLLTKNLVRESGVIMGTTNVRKGPSEKAMIIGALSVDTDVEGIISPINNNWLNITYLGRDAYIWIGTYSK